MPRNPMPSLAPLQLPPEKGVWGLAGRSICQEQLETSHSSSLEDTQEALPQNSASLIPALPSLAARATPPTPALGQLTPLSTFLEGRTPFPKAEPPEASLDVKKSEVSWLDMSCREVG